MVDFLAEYLLDRYDEDERAVASAIAQVVQDDIGAEEAKGWKWVMMEQLERQSKRQIVAYAQEHPMPCHDGSKFDQAQALTLAVVLRYLAIPYADRADFRKEGGWRNDSLLVGDGAAGAVDAQRHRRRVAAHPKAL